MPSIKLINQLAPWIIRLSSRGRKLVTIVDPHLKADAGYSLYRDAIENNMLVIGPEGTAFEGSFAKCDTAIGTLLDSPSSQMNFAVV